MSEAKSSNPESDSRWLEDLPDTEDWRPCDAQLDFFSAGCDYRTSYGRGGVRYLHFRVARPEGSAARRLSELEKLVDALNEDLNDAAREDSPF